MRRTLAGLDIGGTTCAATLASLDGDAVVIEGRRPFATPTSPGETLSRLGVELGRLVGEHGAEPSTVGISCGGPLDSRRGLVLSPPNLPGWDRVDVVTPFERAFGVPALVQNDANAGALAEWMWGAGRGCQNMIFLTFGTGMGAGLVLDGRLYSGTTDAAGEVGHVRLADDGPVGSHKAGSFEGFCSGGGIAQQARTRAERAIHAGDAPSFCPTLGALPTVTAETVGRAAQAGDPLALEVYRAVGERLGQGLAILVDVLNPERIVIGSIYGRQRGLLEPVVMDVLRREALESSLAACAVVPAGLGERVGDYAALAVARQALSDLEGPDLEDDARRSSNRGRRERPRGRA
ncbi:ROK family protein [Rubrivirga sp.]|uniref:ROK family protein n=1 Tax=Rubrivirga sp. TaxID=1885344 RepID=UPI003B521706